MRMRRSIIWANAIDLEVAKEKAISCADAICIDLEDGVAFTKKPQARKMTVEMVKTWDFKGKEKIIRVNPTDTADYDLDMREVIAVALPDAIRVPKCESVSEMLKVDAQLAAIEAAAGLKKNSIEVLAMIESPIGVRNAYDIAACCERVTALSLGMEDLTREMGIKRRYIDNDLDLIYARQKIVVDAKAAGVQAIDSVLLLTQGADEANHHQNEMSKQTGFDGRSVQNNDQAQWANETFAPSAQEVAWAKGACEAYEAHSAEGTVIYEGFEICFAAYQKAKSVVEKARAIEMKK